jgi:hypothetical protein
MGLVINVAIEDGMEIVDESVIGMMSTNLLAEEIEYTDTSQGKVAVKPVVSETAELDADLIVQALLYPILEDAFDLVPDFRTDESLNITMALDTERLAPSVHSMPAFNSFAQIDDDIYAAGDAGIYRLGGNTDDGAAISPGVMWGKISFRMSNQKKIRAVFLEGEVENTRMQAETDSGAAVYSVTRNRIPVGRNLIGRNWALRLSDFDRLEAVELSLVIGRR